nr:leucine-rich repeat domain-containing protein [Clostridiales bacterium]
MKKALSIILSLVLVLAALPLVPIESHAYTILESPDGLWKYYVNDDGTTVTIGTDSISKAYLGTDEDVTVPSTIDGKTVTGLGQGAFAGCNKIKSITVPNSVTSTGYRTFRSCTVLES